MQNKPVNQVNAGFFVRLAAYLLDSLIVGAALLVVKIPFWITSLVNPENIMARDFIFSYSVQDIVLYVIGVTYFIVLTYKNGATIGKKVLHLKVVSVEDRELTLFEIIYRETVGRFLSALIVNIGYFMVGVQENKRGLHDILSDTKVIYYHEKMVYVEAPVQEKTMDTLGYAPATYRASSYGAEAYVAPTYKTEEKKNVVSEGEKMLEKASVESIVLDVFGNCTGNAISEEDAITPDLAGVKMFEAPLVGIGSAKDDLYEKLKQDGVVGPWHMSPGEWLEEGKTVVSLFFPFTEEVKKSNRESVGNPSSAWLHGRIEGQQFIFRYMKQLSEALEAQGMKTCVPGLDERFTQIKEEGVFGSNWSERHTAFICGLGTFGLSKGIITEKGMAGRLGSIIIDQEMAADVRKYTEIYEYCSMCGACTYRCPAEAITLEEGKDHVKCNACLQATKEKFAPRFGCGLCQTKVPCESRIPVKR